MGLSDARLRTVLAWIVVVLTAGPVGGAVWLGIFHGESPCILCWAQRTSMVLIALTALFVLRYGPRPRYLGMVVLLGAGGLYMALRHSGLHLARDVGQGFAAIFFGAHTYTWSLFIHWVVLLVLGVLLLLLREDTVQRGPRDPGRVGRFAMVLFLVVAAGNALQAFMTTGPPPYMGQGDPVRFSWNPQRWVWMKPARVFGPVSLRGAWDIPKPDPAMLDVDTGPASGPLANLATLQVTGWEHVEPALKGRLTDLAYDPGTGRFLAVTDKHGVYVLDATLSRVEHSVVLDPYFAVNLSPPVGAAFLGDTLAVGTRNKSYVLLRPDPAADEDFEWRHFLETSGGVTELRRSRFATVRARQMYVLSLAYDAAADELVTVSVPSQRHRRMVVSTFDRRDLMLSTEFVPRLGPGLDYASPGRSLGEYVVTGAVVVGRTLYAISAAYSTLLTFDLDSRTVMGAYAVPELVHPVGLAVRGEDLLLAQADGRIAVVERPVAGTDPEPRLPRGTP
jgi:disulfide bond formation protein DsbB